MIILTLRTDKPDSELGLFDGETQLQYIIWQAHRQLAETIHLKIRNILQAQNLKLSDLGAIVAYEGSGSFTGLRIGLSVANALAYALRIPIVAGSGEDWIQAGIKAVLAGGNDTVVLPHYGAPVHITQPKH